MDDQTKIILYLTIFIVGVIILYLAFGWYK